MQRVQIAVGPALTGAFAPSILPGLGLLPTALLALPVVVAGGTAIVPGAWSTLYRKTGIGAGAWLLAVSVAAGGIALTYLLGSPQPFCSGPTYRGCLTLYGWASAIFLGSSLGVAIAAGHLGRYRRLRAASLGPAAEADEGLVAVEGRVVPAGDATTGPVSDEPVAWYRHVVESPTPFGGHLEVDAETVDRDLYVQDGSGRLLVLTDVLDAHDVAELSRSHIATDSEQRRREWSYEPDDVVTVVGHVTAVSRAEYPEPKVVGLEGPVVVGQRTLSELRGWAAQRAVVGALVALVVGGGSLLVMLLTA
jgi:hypothetical protein